LLRRDEKRNFLTHERNFNGLAINQLVVGREKCSAPPPNYFKFIKLQPEICYQKINSLGGGMFCAFLRLCSKLRGMDLLVFKLALNE